MSNTCLEQPAWMIINMPYTQQYVKSNKDFILNPWTADKVDTLLPAINISPPERVVIENKKSDNCINEEGGQQIPIYEEIRHLHEVDHTVVNREDEMYKDVAKDIIDDQKHDEKEIIYWHITTKEVAKFQPCTEIFIDRS